MHGMFRILVHIATCSSLALVVPAALPQPIETSQTVLIGLIGSMKISRGQSSRDAAQLAIDEANKRGIKINGKTTYFKLFVADDKSDVNLSPITARAVLAAGVVAVIGHLTTDASIAAAPVYREAGIAQISPTAAGAGFTRLNYPTIFQLLGNSDITPRYLTNALHDFMKARRVVIVDDGTRLGTDLAGKLTENLRDSGIQIVNQDQLANDKTSDFNAAMSKIRSANADVVYFAGVFPQSIAFSQRIVQQGLKSKLLLAGGSINTDFPQRSDDYAEGTMLLAPGTAPGKIPDFKRLEKIYKEQFKAPLIPQSWFAFDAINLLIEAMKQADTVNGKLLVPVLHAMQYNGVSGPISFEKDGRLKNPRYTLYEASKGSWRPVQVFP
jgi:branched-chain amino acid transport system substrate-binding protein